MANGASEFDTIERIAAELAALVEPLALAANTRAFPSFMREFGWDTAAPIAAVSDLAAIADGITELVEEQAGADDGASLITHLVSLFGSIRDLSSGTGLPATIDATQFTQDFPSQLVQYLIVEYLLGRQRVIGEILRTVGVIRLTDQPASGQRPAYRRLEVALDDIQKTLSDPLALAKGAYRWGQADLDALGLLHNLYRLGDALGLDISMRPIGTWAEGRFLVGATFPLEHTQAVAWNLTPHTEGSSRVTAGLAIHVVPAKATDLPGVSVAPFVDGMASERFTLASDLALDIKAGFDVEGGLDLVVRPAKDIELLVDLAGAAAASTAEFAATLTYGASGTPTVLLGSKGGSRFEFGAAEFTFGARMRGSNRSIYGELALRDAAIVIIGGKNADGFLAKLLPDETRAEASITIGLDSTAGLTFTGSGGLVIKLPVHIELGPLEIVGALIAIKPGPQGIPIDLAGTIKGKLGPLQAVVENVGLRATLTFPSGGGNLGPLNVAFGFRPPNGVGMSINAGVVKGGGYLYFDFDEGEYAGALELNFADFLDLKAIGLITTKMPDGSRGFSLLVIITVEFNPGFQLGYGFKLIGVGGLLGLNRTMVLQALAEGVRTGAVNGILFPVDPVANAPRILSDLRAIFPPALDRFLIGPMAKIGWGTPTVISLELGIIIEIPGNIAILGVLRLALGDNDGEAVLVLQVNFVGALEFDKKRGWFFAAIFDSRILTITIEGEMGVLIAVGEDANLLISAGGFHPLYTPPPLPFPSPKRIALSLIDSDYASIRAETYFALTTNSVQMGVAAQLKFDFEVITIDGHFAFDALLRFVPLYFIVQVTAGVSLKVGGAGVFNVDLQLSFEGPTPWRARGHAEVSLLCFKVSKDFDETWGVVVTAMLDPVLVLDLIRKEIEKAENWRALPPASANLLVTLRTVAPAELILHPLGALEFSQNALPLDMTLDKVGEQPLADVKRVSVRPTPAQSGTGPAFATSGEPRRSFAPAQYQTLTDAQKLSAPAFQPMVSGVLLNVRNAGLVTGRGVRRSVRYEETIIDTSYRRHTRRFVELGQRLFAHFAKGAAISKNSRSETRRIELAPFRDGVTLRAEEYAVAYTDDNRAASATFTTEVAAREWMAAATADAPALGAALHVIPAVELSEAA